MRIWPAIALATLAAGTATAARKAPKTAEPTPPLPTYACVRVSTPIAVDGRLDEPAWARAARFTDFRLADGLTQPTHGTEFRAVWDANRLYLSFVCHGPTIIATMTKRDSPLYAEDCVEVFLSTGGDLYRYFEFEFSPHNVQMDASVFPTPGRKDKIVDYGWTCHGLHTATRTTGSGDDQRWAIEIAIPFSSIGRGRKPPTPGQTWRANFYRIEYGTKPEEYICWSPMYGEANFHARDRFGRFVFAEARPLAVRPR